MVFVIRHIGEFCFKGRVDFEVLNPLTDVPTLSLILIWTRFFSDKSK